MARTFFTEMIQEGKAASSCFVPATISAKKQIIQTSRAIIITDMIRMRFCTGLFFPNGFETEIFSASVAEFKGVPVQNCSADLTAANLHSLQILNPNF
jgi:hypothetical protein